MHGKNWGRIARSLQQIGTNYKSDFSSLAASGVYSPVTPEVPQKSYVSLVKADALRVNPSTTSFSRRNFSTAIPTARTKLVPVSPVLRLEDFTNVKKSEELSETSAHDIYIGEKEGKKCFLKDRATHKEFPVSADYPDNVEMQLAYSFFLAQKENLHSDIALSLLGAGRSPKTGVVKTPTQCFAISEELRGYKSVLEIADKRELSEIFEIGPGGETCITGYNLSEKTGEWIKYKLPSKGRIAADKVKLFLGERDPNPRNSGVRLINGEAVIVIIDFDSCGSKMPYSGEDLAFSSPHSVAGGLALPPSMFMRINRRAFVKQEIFNKIAAIDPDELMQYCDAHFDKRTHELFPEKIAELKENLLEAHKAFKEAARVHLKACNSLGVNMEQGKTQGVGRG